MQSLCVQPRHQMFRHIAISNPGSERPILSFLFGINQKQLKPALLAFGPVQIGPLCKLGQRLSPRSPAVAINNIQGRGKAGAILPAGTFYEEGLLRNLERIKQVDEELAGGKRARIERNVVMIDAQLSANSRFVSPPGMSRIMTCLLYTSDAADDLLCVDLGG